MLFVKVITVQLAASERYKQNFIWAKTFIDLAGELPRIFFGCERLHFVLIDTLKAVVTSKFTQSFSQMKFRSKCPDLCLVDSALLARVPRQRLVHMCSVVHAFRRLLVSVSAKTVKRTKPPYHGIACLLSSISSSKNFHEPIFLRN